MAWPMVNRERLVQTLRDLIQINSPSGQEAPAADYIRQVLTALGLASSVDATGNMYARLDGRGPAQEPFLLNAHLDTVQPTPDIKLIEEGGVLRTDGRTVLGADDKAGVAAILEVVRLLTECDAPHPPLDVLFTVQEEVGLVGAKHVEMDRLQARQGIVLDASGPPRQLVVAGPGQNSFEATIIGQSAHAGVAPEQGRSAILAAARAISTMPLGRIDAETTANIGTIRGGQARNIVPDRCELVGEARSRDAGKLAAQTEAMVRGLHEGAERTGCTLELNLHESYMAFRHNDDAPIVQRCIAGIRSLGWEPSLIATGGGSDGNVFNQHGIAAVMLGVGYEDIHTPQEHIALDTVVDVARTVLAILTVPA